MDPRTGRFVGMDPFDGRPFDPPILHKYLYAAGNPLTNVDPSGLLDVNVGSLMAALGIIGVLSNMAGLGSNLRRYYSTDDSIERLTILPSIGLNLFGIFLALVPGAGPAGPAAVRAGSAVVGGEVLLTMQRIQSLGASIVIPVGQAIGAIGILLAQNNHHTAEWQVRDGNGDLKAYGEETSGGTGKARPDWTEQLMSHSERKILEKLRLIAKPGDTVLIRGTKAACNPGGRGCQAAMEAAARELRIKIIYQQEGVAGQLVFGPS